MGVWHPLKLKGKICNYIQVIQQACSTPFLSLNPDFLNKLLNVFKDFMFGVTVFCFSNESPPLLSIVNY